MPITLPPLSRRRFLATAAAAGGWAALAHSPLRALAAGDGVDPRRIALLADTHIAQDRQIVNKGVNPAEHLAKVVEQVVAASPRPTHAIILGDLAINHGEPGDYPVFLELIRPLRAAGMNVHLTLGNHDDREHFLAAATGALGPFDPPPVANKFVAVLPPFGKTRLLLMDSLDLVNHTPGRLDEAQLRWLTAELDADPQSDWLLLGHHYIERDVIYGDAQSEGETSLVGMKPGTGLIDGAAFARCIGARRQVKAHCFGHSHCWQQGELEGIALVNVPATSWVFIKEQPQGWVLLDLDEGGARFTLQSLDPAHAQAGQRVDLRWRTA